MLIEKGYWFIKANSALDLDSVKSKVEKIRASKSGLLKVFDSNLATNFALTDLAKGEMALIRVKEAFEIDADINIVNCAEVSSNCTEYSSIKKFIEDNIPTGQSLTVNLGSRNLPRLSAGEYDRVTFTYDDGMGEIPYLISFINTQTSDSLTGIVETLGYDPGYPDGETQTKMKNYLKQLFCDGAIDYLRLD